MNNLIERAKQRDAEAFTQLMQSQMQNMYKTARALLSNEEDAADAISDTILSCWEKLDQLQEPSYFRTWMTRILINKCRDLQRRSARFYPAEEVPEQAEAGPRLPLGDAEEAQLLPVITGIMQSGRAAVRPEKRALLSALRPFVAEDVASQFDRALRLAGMAGMARAALGQLEHRAEGGEHSV